MQVLAKHDATIRACRDDGLCGTVGGVHYDGMWFSAAWGRMKHGDGTKKPFPWFTPIKIQVGNTPEEFIEPEEDACDVI